MSFPGIRGTLDSGLTALWQRTDWACFNKSNFTRQGGCLDHFQGIYIGAGAPLVCPPAGICAYVEDERGPCDYLLGRECIVMQSRCHSTFTFQASDPGRTGVEECLHV